MNTEAGESGDWQVPAEQACSTTNNTTYWSHCVYAGVCRWCANSY